MVTDPLCTVSEVKEKLHLTVATEDALLERLVLAVSARVRTYCHRDFTLGTYALALNGTGTPVLLAPQYPILAVASVAVGAPGQTMQPLTLNTDYLWDEDALYRVSCAWPRGIQNVAVTWTGGYEATPWDLADATAKWTAASFRELDRIETKSKSIGGEVVAFRLATMPADVEATIDQYVGWGTA